MSPNGRETMKLKHLNEKQKEFVILYFSQGKRVREILRYFMANFPDFGIGVDPKRLKQLLSERFRKMRTSHRDKIETLRERIQPDIARPRALQKYLLFCVQQLWWETPRVMLKDTGVDANGEPYEIGQLRTRSLLKVLERARSMSKYPEVDVIPIARQVYRLERLQELWEQTPRVMLTKVGVDVKGSPYALYQSQVWIHLAILTEARKDSQDFDWHSIPIAHPAYRIQCLQDLWEEAPILLAMEQRVGAKSGSNTNHKLEKLRLKILGEADLEKKALLRAGWVATPKDVETLPLVFAEYRNSLL